MARHPVSHWLPKQVFIGDFLDFSLCQNPRSERRQMRKPCLVAFVAHLRKCGKIGLNVLLRILVSGIMQLGSPLADARVMLFGGC
ncbi:MAG: hypothetical protein BWY63_01033 [Chloroflexi bacterium ADurb.Bin360]|nr:MAG: hypothetical protein BWY63_01033 [Chloroflexi bacterium ADurb.Bin360]